MIDETHDATTLRRQVIRRYRYALNVSALAEHGPPPEGPRAPGERLRAVKAQR